MNKPKMGRAMLAPWPSAVELKCTRELLAPTLTPTTIRGL